MIDCLFLDYCDTGGRSDERCSGLDQNGIRHGRLNSVDHILQSDYAVTIKDVGLSKILAPRYMES